MIWDVVAVVTARLVVLRAAHSELHFNLIEMSEALPALHFVTFCAFCDVILNTSNAVPVPHAGQFFKLVLC